MCQAQCSALGRPSLGESPPHGGGIPGEGIGAHWPGGRVLVQRPAVPVLSEFVVLPEQAHFLRGVGLQGKMSLSRVVEGGIVCDLTVPKVTFMLIFHIHPTFGCAHRNTCIISV